MARKINIIIPSHLEDVFEEFITRIPCGSLRSRAGFQSN